MEYLYYCIVYYAPFKTILRNNCMKSRKMLFLSQFYLGYEESLWNESNCVFIIPEILLSQKEITAKRSREHIEQSYYPNGSFMSISPNLCLISPFFSYALLTISSENFIISFYYFAVKSHIYRILIWSLRLNLKNNDISISKI